MVKKLIKCRNSPNIFCYICGKFCVQAQRKAITEKTKSHYLLYFHRAIEIQEWAPNICCKSCEVNLNSWWNGLRLQMPFAIPMMWKKQRNHRNECYFCMCNITGFSSKNKNKIAYPDCQSATKPILHNESYPVPVTPNQLAKGKESTVVTENISPDVSVLEDPDYVPEEDPDEPHRIDQSELNDLVRDLGLNKNKSELLGSRLLQWNLLKSETKVTLYRSRNEPLLKYFKKENSICFCQDIEGLMTSFGFVHNPDEWRLFIDGSTDSLKAVLLHNGNEKPSIPLAHTVELDESHDNLKSILSVINYDINQWQICCDLKVVSMLLGMQGGYTKYMCFLCMWDSRADDKHYVQKHWPKRINFVPGEANVENTPLVDPKKNHSSATAHQTGTHQKLCKKVKARQQSSCVLKRKISQTV